MKKLMIGLSMVALAVLMTGCASTSMREAVQKEYERVISLPPAEQVLSPNKQVNDVGRLSFDQYNFCHSLLKEYVAKTTNHRAYLGFMNDVQVLIKDEGLSEEDAVAKQYALIQEEDKARPEGEKLWPSIEEGWAAANALDPKKKLAEIARLAVRNQEISESAKKLPDSYKDEDFKSKLERGAESGNISKQLAQTAEMLGFLGDQYRRVQKLKSYQK